MADTSARAAQMARILAIVHIIVGFLLFCFGIADLLVGYFWTGYGCFGIWIGVWMCIAGSLGIPGTRKERSTSRDVFASVFMGFSITSAVFGGIIIICYSISIAIYRSYYYGYYSTERYYDTEMALTVIILILGIVEFAIGIWASVCICLTNPCRTCCYNTQQQQGQVMYTANTGYVMTQGPSGVPMAMPMQAGGDMVAVQATTTGTQGGQPQMVLVPVSGAMGNQHQYTPQAAQHGARGYQPQQVQLPPVHGRGQCVTLENEQDAWVSLALTRNEVFLAMFLVVCLWGYPSPQPCLVE